MEECLSKRGEQKGAIYVELTMKIYAITSVWVRERDGREQYTQRANDIKIGKNGLSAREGYRGNVELSIQVKTKKREEGDEKKIQKVMHRLQGKFYLFIYFYLFLFA